MHSTRISLARAFSHSKLTSGFALAPPLPEKTLTQIEIAYARSLRYVYGDFWTPLRQQQGIKDRFTVVKDAGLPHLIETLRIDWLRLAARMVRAPDALLALLQGPAGRDWRQQLAGDLRALVAVLPKLLSTMTVDENDLTPGKSCG